jgi:hypothetical protein
MTDLEASARAATGVGVAEQVTPDQQIVAPVVEPLPN